MLVELPEAVDEENAVGITGNPLLEKLIVDTSLSSIAAPSLPNWVELVKHQRYWLQEARQCCTGIGQAIASLIATPA